MAKTIVTYCDRHLRDGQEVNAAATQVSIDGRTVEIDLCEECRTDVLGPVLDLLTEYGQPVKKSNGKKSDDREKIDCPVCGKSYVSAKGLREHLRRLHPDTTIEQGTLPVAAIPESQPIDERKYPCPDCDRMFLRPQAVGAHRSRVHGYVSPTAEKNQVAIKRRKNKKNAAAA